MVARKSLQFQHNELSFYAFELNEQADLSFGDFKLSCINVASDMGSNIAVNLKWDCQLRDKLAKASRTLNSLRHSFPFNFSSL